MTDLWLYNSLIISEYIFSVLTGHVLFMKPPGGSIYEASQAQAQAETL